MELCSQNGVPGAESSPSSSIISGQFDLLLLLLLLLVWWVLGSLFAALIGEWFPFVLLMRVKGFVEDERA